MRINQVRFCSLMIISCLAAGNGWQLVNDAQASSEYSAPMIITRASVEINKPGIKNAPKDPLYGSYSEDEVDLMAVICYREARGEGIEGMRLVADVILNRVDSDSFPDTIKEVISQKNQFTSYRKDDMTEEDLTIDCYGAVLAELAERTDPEILYFTSGGYGKYGTPAYKSGNHYFSR